MLELSGAGGSATKMFTQIDREVTGGSSNIPKAVAILRSHGVAVGADPDRAVAGDETMAR